MVTGLVREVWSETLCGDQSIDLHLLVKSVSFVQTIECIVCTVEIDNTSPFQRGAKASYVQHEDLLILDKILKKEKINLPKLIIYQMNHLKNLNQLGFSRVIKKVLQIQQCYSVTSVKEEPIVREFDPDLFKKMKLVKNQDQGWIRTKAPQLVDMIAESEFNDEESDEESGFDTQSVRKTKVAHNKDVLEEFAAQKISTIVKEIFVIKEDLSFLKKNLSEMEKNQDEQLKKIAEGVATLLKECNELLQSRDAQP